MRTLPVKQSFWVKAVAAQQLYLLLSLKPWQKVQPWGSSWLSCENVSPNTKHSPQHNLFTADSLSESTSSVSCLSHSPPCVSSDAWLFGHNTEHEEDHWSPGRGDHHWGDHLQEGECGGRKGWVWMLSLLGYGIKKVPKIFGVLKLVETFSWLLRIASRSRVKKKKKKWHARRFPLQTTSSALKGAIQLGITHTVGSLSQKAERDVLMQDFVVVESIFFPR